MTVAPTLQQYLADNGVEFDTLTHPETPSASRTAQASHVPGDRLAKGVVLKRGDAFLLAVIPASRHLLLEEVRKHLQSPASLATEAEIKPLFSDCAVGAVPALGGAYGLSMLVDESLEGQPDVYVEGGDHRTLVHISGEAFRRLVEGAPHGRFSETA